LCNHCTKDGELSAKLPSKFSLALIKPGNERVVAKAPHPAWPVSAKYRLMNMQLKKVVRWPNKVCRRIGYQRPVRKMANCDENITSRMADF